MMGSLPKIQVTIRKRPLSFKELANQEVDIIEVQSHQVLIVHEQKQKVDLTKYIEEHLFKFDTLFDEATDNQTLFIKLIRPLIRHAIAGERVTCFAYGQTGSEKT